MEGAEHSRQSKVSLHLNSDEEGSQVVTFEGSARIYEGHPLAREVAAYLARYRQGIANIAMTRSR